jgi:hypothetical protein
VDSPHPEKVTKDLLVALRQLRTRSPFAASAILLLAVAIGANVTIFSVAFAMFSNGAAYRDATALAAVKNVSPTGDLWPVKAAEYREWKQEIRAVEELALYRRGESYQLTGDSEPERLLGSVTTASLFPLLGVRPKLGRVYREEEEQPGLARVAVLSHGLWTRRFGASNSVVGQRIQLNGVSHEVIGVMPPEFRYPDSTTELWTPLSVPPKEIQERFLTIKKYEYDDSFKAREMSWAAARKIADDFPLFGVGVRCSNLYSYRYGADFEGRTIHSQYLQVAADCGWAGLACYGLMIATAFGCMWRARWRLRKYTDFESRRAYAMLGGIEIALITFLVGASALSLEVFELPYLMLLLGTQLWAIMNATDTAPAPALVTAARVPAAPPRPAYAGATA